MKKTSFNDGWSFRKKDGAAVPVTLPHDATILEERDPQSPAGSGYAFFPGGFYLYEKTFLAPEAWEGKVLLLLFEGVYPKAEVFVNDQPVGCVSYGYSEYYIPLTGLHYGSENTIRVEVDNEAVPNSRWYAGAGIYRPVSLLEGEKTHIDPDGIRVSTLSLDPPTVQIEVEHTAADADVLIEIFKRDPQTGEAVEKITEAVGSRVQSALPDAKLWDAEHPNLYLCRASIVNHGAVIDAEETAFGIRTLSWSDDGFFVNGKSVLLKGGCIHHDNGILGARTYREAESRRVKILKSGGFNAIRSAHNPMCRYALNACDELGMYVMDEAWDMWDKNKNPGDYANRFPDHYEEDLTAMIRKDFNHPSVIMYSIGNEVTEPAKPEGVALAEKLVQKIKSLDTTRPVTAGLNLTLLFMSTWENNPLEAIQQNGNGEDTSANVSRPSTEPMNSTAYNQMIAQQGNSMTRLTAMPQADAIATPVLNLLDIQGYNYASCRYENEKTLHPERILVGSETYPYDLAANWDMVERLPWLIGDFMWTSWDHLGEVGLGAWGYDPEDASSWKIYPWLLSGAGAYDILGDDTAKAGRAAVIWDALDTPYIGVRPVNHPGVEPYHAMWRDTNAIPHWSWKGCEGNPATVEVFTKGTSVELFLNDRLIGRSDVSEYRAIFETVYEPGILKAVAYDAAGVAIGESTLCSADENIKITITLEGSAKVGSLLYVNIDLADADGTIECNRDTRLTLDVQGAQLLAFGSANPKTEELFHTNTHSTYYGRSQAVLRIKDSEAVLQVTGEGLSPAQMILKTE